MRFLIPRPSWVDRRLANEWSSFFEDFERMFEVFPEATRERAEASVYRPAYDLHEDESQYVLTLDVPGVRREDLKVEVAGGRIRITGERKREIQETKGGVERLQRGFGRFERVFALPEDVLEEQVEAHHEDGVLTLRLPKVVKAKAALGRTIEIQSGRGGGFLGKLLNRQEKKDEPKGTSNH